MHQFQIATTLWLVMVALALPAFALDNFPPGTAGGPLDLRSYTRFVHLAPGVCPLTVSLSGRQVAALTYQQCTRYLPIMQGNYTVSLQPLGQSLLDPNSAYGPLSLYALFYSTVLIVGQPDAVRVLPLPDDPMLPSVGWVRVRFVNAAYKSPPLTLSQQGGERLFWDLPFGCISEYRTIRRRACGYTITTPIERCIVSLPPQSKEVKVYTVVIYRGETADEPYKAMVLQDRRL